MKLLPAECRGTAQSSQDLLTHSLWVPSTLILWSFKHSTWESRTKVCLSLLSRFTFTRTRRLCCAPPHPLAEPELAASKGGAGRPQSLCSRGDSGTETQEQHRLSQCYSQDSSWEQQSCHPCFCLVDCGFPFLLQKFFFLKASRGMVCSQQSHLFLAQVTHLRWERSSGLGSKQKLKLCQPGLLLAEGSRGSVCWGAAGARLSLSRSWAFVTQQNSWRSAQLTLLAHWLQTDRECVLAVF